MDGLESVAVALEALRANKLRSGLTMLGIIIGVGAVITLMSVGSGAQAAIAQNIKGLGANLITITPGATNAGGVSLGNGTSNTLTRDDATAIADPGISPAVAAVSPELSLPFNAQLVYRGQNVSTKVAGVTPSYEDVRSAHVAQGAWFTEEDMTARSLVVVLGDGVAQTLFGATDATGQNVSIRFGPRPVQLRVVGVLQSKGGGPLANLDDQALIPLTTLQKSFNNPQNPKGLTQVSTIVVQAVDGKQIEAAKVQVTQLLLQRHNVATPDFVIQTQDDQIATQTGVTQTLTILLGAIAGISLVVGGIGIMNIMIVSVTERTREIGIRKAVGAKRLDILVQFLVESLMVSVLGGLIGIFLGIGAARAVDGTHFNGQVLQTLVSTDSILLAAGVSLAIGLVFGVYPAYRAASLHPIDALRYE